MAIQVTDEYYPEYGEHERYVSGDHSSVSLCDEDHAIVEICGIDLEMRRDRLVDLRDVLNAAVDMWVIS